MFFGQSNAKSASPPSAAVAPSTAGSLDRPNMAARSHAARAWRATTEPGFAGRSNVGPRSVHGEGEHTRARGLARGIVGRSAERQVGRTGRKTCAAGHTEAGGRAPRRGCREAGGGVRPVGATGGLTTSGLRAELGRPGVPRPGHEVRLMEGGGDRA